MPGKELGTLQFTCSLEEVDLDDITKNQTNTIKACLSKEPGPGNCPALERSTLDEGKCLQAIYEDLSAYRAELRNLNDQKLLAAIDNMMEGGSRSRGQPEEGRAPTLPMAEQVRLCILLQTFRTRALSITRLMGFLCSPGSSL
ncbi:PREDICTED: interleukin-12 subunit alpha [Chaetura pelagica]|uniref:interleukin-12 subunit alpha n=1 Tax=Chaetura pelagica TaxID=8897 RepID=UPI0005233160|nr:PREDICTED: interleukin-12 subunit alpha [Chaetura pelagica]